MNRVFPPAALFLALCTLVPVPPAFAQPAASALPASAPIDATGARQSEGAAPALPNSLSTALATALNDRPEFRTAALRTDIARERIRQAVARFYPTVDLLITAQNNTIYDTFSGITATGTLQGQVLTVDVARSSPRYTINPALQLSYELYTGGRDSALLRNAQAAHQADALAAQAQTREVLRDVTLAYLRLGQAWHRWRTATQWAEFARSQERATAVRLEAGRASELETQTDALARAQRDVDAQTLSHEVAARHADFLRALGRPSASLRSRPEELTPALANFERELDALMARGIVQDGAELDAPGTGPELRRAHALAEAARETVSVEKSANLPQVRLQAQYVGAGRSDASLGSALTHTRRSSFAAAVVVSFNLFSGYMTQSRVAEAKANAERMQEEAASVQRKLALAHQNLALGLAKAGVQLQLAQQRRQLEALRLQVAQAKHSAGRAFTDEVDKAQAALAAADAEILDRRIDEAVAQVRLQFVSTNDLGREAQP
jgi:outer membrane protein TolC